jgi:nitric oxide reductase NorD protein
VAARSSAPRHARTRRLHAHRPGSAPRAGVARPRTRRRKIILLITDGRPCDYDRYESTYGIQDVKKAIETGRQHGIQTHAFAVEKQAAEYFPAMFTRRSYDIIPNPACLTETMCRLFARVLRGA